MFCGELTESFDTPILTWQSMSENGQSPPSPQKEKERSLAIDTGPESFFIEKFYLIRQLSKKPGRAVWRKVTLRPPEQSADAFLAGAVVTIKRPAIQPSPSLSTHFSINMKMAKESQTQIYKFAPSIQWKDTPSKFFQMVCTAGQKLKLGQF